MMDNETWMSAKTALNEGFIDGMLYSDKSEEPVENAFMYSKFAIQNSITESMKRFFDQYEKLVSAKARAEPGAFTQQAPTDVFNEKIKLNRRKNDV